MGTAMADVSMQYIHIKIKAKIRFRTSLFPNLCKYEQKTSTKINQLSLAYEQIIALNFEVKELIVYHVSFLANLRRSFMNARWNCKSSQPFRNELELPKNFLRSEFTNRKERNEEIPQSWIEFIISYASRNSFTHIPSVRCIVRTLIQPYTPYP